MRFCVCVSVYFISLVYLIIDFVKVDEVLAVTRTVSPCRLVSKIVALYINFKSTLVYLSGYAIIRCDILG